MNKTTSTELIDEIADDLNQYLKDGHLNIGPFFSHPNLEIHDIEDLLMLHFVLSRGTGDGDVGVIDFLGKLPERLKRVRSTTEPKETIMIGEVRGRVSHQKTLSQRLAKGCLEDPCFVCEEKQRDFQVAENIVLKSLMVLIERILNSGIISELLNRGYDYVNEWAPGSILRANLDYALHRNVYLRSIEASGDWIDPKFIEKAMRSRNDLYREAAVLLRRHQNLRELSLDEDDARDLLRATMVLPDSESTLFELYWTIKLLRKIGGRNLHVLKQGNSLVANWEDEGYTYEMYHDSPGPLRFNIQFQDAWNIFTKDDSDIGMRRDLFAIKELSIVTGRSCDDLWLGRPDILILKRRPDGGLANVFIGEVKYTINSEYAYQGLKELMEYMALAEYNNEFVTPYGTTFESNIIKGALFVDSCDKKSLKCVLPDNIKIFRFGDEIEF